MSAYECKASMKSCRRRKTLRPVSRASLDAIAAFNVFHHLPDPAGFPRRKSRACPGGRHYRAVVYPVGSSHRALHHEPYLSEPSEWRIVGEGRLAGANHACRRACFATEAFSTRVSRPSSRRNRCQVALSLSGLRLNTRIPGAARGLVNPRRARAPRQPSAGNLCHIIVQRR